MAALGACIGLWSLCFCIDLRKRTHVARIWLLVEPSLAACTLLARLSGLPTCGGHLGVMLHDGYGGMQQTKHSAAVNCMHGSEALEA